MQIAQLLTVAQLSCLLQLSQRQIWRLKAAGKLPPPVRIGRAVRWNAEDIHRWLKRE